MLTQEQKQFYDENGYLMVEDVITSEQLKKLQQITYALIEDSRQVSQSNEVYDLDDGHNAETPRLTRIKLPHKQNPYYWNILKQSGVTEVLRDILGNDTTIITSKLNTKSPGGGSAVEWHQDWAFYPHTNDNVLALGLMLNDVDIDNGPLMVIPKSHKGPMLSHNNNGVFCGAINPEDKDFEIKKAVTLTGKARSMTIHHARTLHGSAPNNSNRNRLILFYECNSADAWPLVGVGAYLNNSNPIELCSQMEKQMVCGQVSYQPRMENIPVVLPLPPAPDYGSIFTTQKTGGAKSAF